ncbi:MAG: sugar ABC transporter permease [Eubacteriales bacterium]|nr:sugar ABC transporter permease [Eubacteriales bacterium]
MIKKKMYPRYFLILTLAVYIVFYIAPSILGVIYSFTNRTIYTQELEFVGLENYIRLLQQKRFLTGMKNTFSFMIVTTILKNVVGFGLALLLNTKMKSRNILRAVFYLPVILSTLIVGKVFVAMLLPDTGLVAQFLGLFSKTLAHYDWLGNPDTAMYMVMLVDVWKGAGYCMVIYLAGLQVVPQDCYESAAIDGANAWTKFWKITLPLMISSVSVNVLLCVIGGLKVFDIIIALTNGGPGMSTQVLNTTIYSYFGSGALSTGCAANVLLTILVVVFFAFINGIFGKWEAKVS